MATVILSAEECAGIPIPERDEDANAYLICKLLYKKFPMRRGKMGPPYRLNGGWAMNYEEVRWANE